MISNHIVFILLYHIVLYHMISNHIVSYCMILSSLYSCLLRIHFSMFNWLWIPCGAKWWKIGCSASSVCLVALCSSNSCRTLFRSSFPCRVKNQPSQIPSLKPSSTHVKSYVSTPRKRCLRLEDSSSWSLRHCFFSSSSFWFSSTSSAFSFPQIENYPNQHGSFFSDDTMNSSELWWTKHPFTKQQTTSKHSKDAGMPDSSQFTIHFAKLLNTSICAWAVSNWACTSIPTELNCFNTFQHVSTATATSFKKLQAASTSQHFLDVLALGQQFLATWWKRHCEAWGFDIHMTCASGWGVRLGTYNVTCRSDWINAWPARCKGPPRSEKFNMELTMESLGRMEDYDRFNLIR